MKYVYFKISAIFPDAGANKLNDFISNHAVTSIGEKFVDDGQNSFWSVRVVVTENFTKNPVDNSKPKRASVDYRDVLNPEVFAIYARLRTLRNNIAEQQSMPAYAIFTNE